MYEYKFLHLNKQEVEKTEETVNKRGKVKKETFTDYETMGDFLLRVERTTNDLAKNGWEIISINYSVPIEGEKGPGGAGYTTSDHDSAEFVIALQRRV